MRTIKWICLFCFITADVTLAVVTDIQVNKDPDIVLEGGNITITCTGTCSNSTCVQVNPDEGVFTDVQRGHNNTYTCTVRDVADGTTANKTIMFDVHYGPESVQIYRDNTPAGDDIKVIEGEATSSYSIICMRGDCSSCALSWKGPARVPSKVTNSSLPLFAQDTTFIRKNSGNFKCVAKNTITNNEVSATFHLIVQYSPKMTLNWNEASKTLTCIPNGIPKEYTFYHMEQWLNDQMIRLFPLDILRNEGTYRFIDYSYQDTGIYKCTANNGIKSDGKLNKTTSRFLLFEDKPVIVDQKPSYNVSKGDSLELMFDVYARPNIVTVELFDSRHQTITIYSSHSLRRINILAHYTTVEVNGTRFILKLTKVLEEYFYKPLKVRFENSKGKASTSVTLYPEGTPDIPGNFFSTEISHNSVKFKLETGFFNGSPQTLVIEYRKPESTLEWIIGASQMAGTAKNDLLEVSVTGLEPEATYEFKAFAHNEFGRSNYTDVIKATLKAMPASSSKLSKDSHIAMIVSLLVLGIIFIIGVVVCVTRRKRGSPEAPADRTKTNYKPLDIVVTDLSASTTVRPTVIRKAADINTDSNHQNSESNVNGPSVRNKNTEETEQRMTSELGLTEADVEKATPGPDLTDGDVETTAGQERTGGNKETATPGLELTEVNEETVSPGKELTEVNVETATPGLELTEANVETTTTGQERTGGNVETATPGLELTEVNEETVSPGQELTEVNVETATPELERTEANGETATPD